WIGGQRPETLVNNFVPLAEAAQIAVVAALRVKTILQDGGLDPRGMVQLLELLEPVTITDAERPNVPGIHERLHRLPRVHRLSRVRKRRVQDQTVQIRGAQIVERDLTRLLDLRCDGRTRIVRNLRGVVTAERRELGLYVELFTLEPAVERTGDGGADA